MNTSKNVSKDIKAMQNGDKNRRTLIQIVVAVVLIALVAAIALFIVNKDSTSGDASAAAGSGASTGAQLTPSSLTDDGAIRFGNPDATTVISVVEDFQCPACKNFESISGSTLQQLAAAGNVAVDYRPISILDRFSNGTMYSTRAASAAVCVAENDRDNWMNWHTAMFEQQPSEGGTGLTDDELVAIAAAAGADSPRRRVVHHRWQLHRLGHHPDTVGPRRRHQRNTERPGQRHRHRQPDAREHPRRRSR
nr:thioredoxin domain-containing protein [Rhodococcus sp. BS-15]